MRLLLPAVLALTLARFAACALLDERQGLLGVTLGWPRDKVEAKLGHPSTAYRPSPAAARSTGCVYTRRGVFRPAYSTYASMEPRR
jgi:hypothetical protein